MNIRKHRGRKLVSLILVVLILQLSFPVTAEVLNQSNLDLNYFLYIKSLIENNYFYDLTESELMEGAIKGLFQALDENSQYYTKEEYEKLVEDLSVPIFKLIERNNYLVSVIRKWDMGSDPLSQK